MNAWIIVGSLVLLAQQQSPDSAPKAAPVATTVCAILAEPSKYDQLLVTIRGELVATRETEVLENRSCTNVLSTGEHVWPPAVSLTSPNSETGLPPGYQQDNRSLKPFYAAVAAADPVYRKPRIVVTMTGKIDARRSYSGRKAPDGVWIGNGFGHMNRYAVQLVMMSVSDWEITPRQENKGKPRDP
jgi:hypothetical protein